MPLVNYSSKELVYKVVYYGPGLGGKTTNLKYIHNQLSPETRGDMVSLATETERTLFFDFMPVNFGKVNNFDVRMGLYTVPGQQEYNRSRRLILHDVDAIIFVADSASERMEDNLISLLNMDENLHIHKIKLENIPWVIQFNKRDLETALPVEDLERTINGSYNVPSYEAIAIDGRGVFSTLKAVVKMVIDKG